MYFYCHGVRGSRPVPLSAHQLLTLQANVNDILSDEDIRACRNDKKLLMKYLRKYISEHDLHMLLGVGGNTPCIELKQKQRSTAHVIFDMGTGLSNVMPRHDTNVFHIFMTHFHYDHVQGMPFAPWLYDSNVIVHFYSPVKGFKSILNNIMQPPYFPITTESMTKNMYFHELGNMDYIDIDNLHITWTELNHPGGSYAYKVQSESKSFCFYSDVDVREDSFADTQANQDFLLNIDAMVLDASMGFIDAVEKQDWGHTSLFKGLSFCKRWNVKKVYLYHFDPQSTPEKTAFDYQIALWYNKAIQSKTKVFFAQEDVRFSV